MTSTGQRPPARFVSVVTGEHGQVFADHWTEFSFDRGAITEACSEAGIVEWQSAPSDDVLTYYRNVENEIAQRVADQLRSAVVETFVRIANAVIEQARMRTEASLVPPRIETVEAVTREHGLAFAEHVYDQTVDSEVFSEAFGRTRVMMFPSDDYAAQEHFHRLKNEIRDRLHDDTKELVADAFVRIVGDVISRERRRR